MSSPDPYYEDWLCTVLAWVEDYPGYWTAALCRLLNGLTGPWQEVEPPPDWPDYTPPDADARRQAQQAVLYCGLCSQYVNPRKRARAACLPAPLPGFERGAYQLHGPCRFMQLGRLQKMLHRLQAADLVRSQPGAVIPDGRNHRGWDFATRWWPT